MAVSDHPRIRGEHFGRASADLAATGSSPHTRGARSGVRTARGARGIIPAYAGSTDGRSDCHCAKRDHPRIRGEHRRPSPTSKQSVGSSPHTRGAPHVLAFRQAFRRDHPRIRGEHAGPQPGRRVLGGSSPHTRGALEQDLAGVPEGRIIPAYAGSTSTRRPRPCSPRDHPRIRGEHPIAVHMKAYGTGSSPHTRGAPVPRLHANVAVRIIPAYAGSTFRLVILHIIVADHPRIRGEHRRPSPTSKQSVGSSPHTRGARHPRARVVVVERIIPAYAGSTLCARVSVSLAKDHPRIRGEHPWTFKTA